MHDAHRAIPAIQPAHCGILLWQATGFIT